ncbi:4496_t:CDS:2, partial [Scutellospora calospora]
SSKDMTDLKSEVANKLDMVFEVSEVLSQENDKYKVKFDELKAQKLQEPLQNNNVNLETQELQELLQNNNINLEAQEL